MAREGPPCSALAARLAGADRTSRPVATAGVGPELRDEPSPDGSFDLAARVHASFAGRVEVMDGATFFALSLKVLTGRARG